LFAVATFGAEVAGDFSSVVRAEAVGKTANVDITGWCSVGIIILSARVFVRAVAAILDSITEEPLLETVSVSTCQMVVLANGFIRAQQRLHLSLPGQLITVLHCVLPIAGLFLQIEGKAGRTTDGLKPGARALDNVTAVLFSGGETEKLSGRFVLTQRFLMVASVLTEDGG
jgi:hypothetical protein